MKGSTESALEMNGRGGGDGWGGGLRGEKVGGQFASSLRRVADLINVTLRMKDRRRRSIPLLLIVFFLPPVCHRTYDH